jgi:hypothetical protein
MRLIHTFASYFAFQNNQDALTSSILSQNSGIVIVERQMYLTGQIGPLIRDWVSIKRHIKLYSIIQK